MALHNCGLALGGLLQGRARACANTIKETHSTPHMHRRIHTGAHVRTHTPLLCKIVLSRYNCVHLNRIRMLRRCLKTKFTLSSTSCLCLHFKWPRLHRPIAPSLASPARPCFASMAPHASSHAPAATSLFRASTMAMHLHQIHLPHAQMTHSRPTSIAMSSLRLCMVSTATELQPHSHTYTHLSLTPTPPPSP